MLTVLGIELDSLTLQARLPRDKFERIVALLESWSVKRHCSKELESLTGTLHHVCKVIPQGRTFIRHMINSLSAFWRDDHPIRLNRELNLDLSWWSEFFVSWDGLSFLLSPHGRPSLISRYHLTQLELLAMVQFLAMTGCEKLVHCSTTSVNPLQGTFSCSRGCLALGSQMGHQTGGALFG